MARLRQIYPQNYGSSSSIHTEFESVIRYLNAAELGNKTLAELLAQLFDEDGNFAGPVEFQRDADGGIEYRVGEWDNEDDGWELLVSLDEIRGEPGVNVGEIGAPLLYGREDFSPAAASTTLDYSFASTDAILVFVNGLLMLEGASADYTLSLTGGSTGGSAVIFNTPFAGTESVALFKVRSELISGYTRVDYETIASQTTFAFVHDETSRLLVYVNGILQREGGAYDYTSDANSNTITFLSPIGAGNTVSILTVENALTTAVTGLMLEETYVNSATGLINYAKIGVADGQIPMAKVSGLTTLSNESAKLTVGAGTPVSPSSGDLWVDTSATPNQLKFWDGSQWLRTTPTSSLPSFSASDALNVLRVNGTGTALEFSAVDLSSVIPLAQKGTASGVATLDSSAKLPAAQLPGSISRLSVAHVQSGAITNGTIRVQRLWNQRIEADSLALRVGAGTLTAQFAINGVGVGSTYAVSTTPTEVVFGEGGDPNAPQDIDATGASKTIDIIVTGAAGASDLDIVVGCSVTP